MQISHPGRGGREEGTQGLRQRGVCPLWDTTRPKKGVLAGMVIPGLPPWAGANERWTGVNLAINRILPYRVVVICAWAGRGLSAFRSLPSLSGLIVGPM